MRSPIPIVPVIMISVSMVKIAGISLTAQTKALVVMAYISILGDQNFRGSLVRGFYDNYLAGHANELGFLKFGWHHG